MPRNRGYCLSRAFGPPGLFRGPSWGAGLLGLFRGRFFGGALGPFWSRLLPFGTVMDLLADPFEVNL